MRGALRRANRAARRDPLSWVRWLPVQHRYRSSLRAERLLRAGNQIGKTWGALGDLLEHALGTHPFRPCSTAGEFWIICASWSQSVAVQGKLNDLLPRDLVSEDTPAFDDKNGFGAKNPTVKVRHVDGSWSVIRFKTTRQGALNLASATIDGALFDEPPTTQRIYSEVRKRVMRRSGWVSIAMTPVNAPVQWIKELAESGGIEDIHTRMTPEALIPIGATDPIRLKDGTVCDAAWIEAEIAKTVPHEVPVVIHGEWEMRSMGRYFDCFISMPDAPGAHVHDRIPLGRLTVCLGIDHGDRPGKQIALLVVVAPPKKERDPKGNWREVPPQVYVLDTYEDTAGSALPEDDARGILDMLRRHGMQWASLDHARGDRVHRPGTGAQKSNKDLQAQIAKRMRIPSPDLRPPIRTAKRGEGRGAGSVMVGSRWLYHQMVRDGGFGIHPRNARLIKALDNYDPVVDDDNKDPVDALRYALDGFIFGQWKPGSTVVRFK